MVRFSMDTVEEIRSKAQLMLALQFSSISTNLEEACRGPALPRPSPKQAQRCLHHFGEPKGTLYLTEPRPPNAPPRYYRWPGDLSPSLGIKFTETRVAEVKSRISLVL